MSIPEASPLPGEGIDVVDDTFPLEATQLPEMSLDISFDESIIPIETPNIIISDISSLDWPVEELIQAQTIVLPPLSTVDLTDPYSAPYALGDLVDEDIRRTTQAIDELALEAEQLNDAIQEEIASIPDHPWDRFVSECVDDTYVPLTIQDLDVADDFCPTTYVPLITAIGEKFDQMADLHLQEFEKNCDRTDYIGNVFTVLSGDEFILDKPRAVDFIKFAELVRNLPLEMLDVDPLGVANKLVSHYVKINS
jgi:hypothetical protein